jgi:hypothetical protein
VLQQLIGDAFLVLGSESGRFQDIDEFRIPLEDVEEVA